MSEQRRFVAVNPATITEPTALSIGLFAYTGQGKTESSLRLAMGMRRITGRRIVFADCDNGRGLHYVRGTATAPAMFPDVEYIDFKPPHNALDYVALLAQYEHENAILVIDNMTAEHDGEGGLLDTFEHAKQGKESRNAVAWGVAKTQHKKLLRAFPIVNRKVPIIVTWRAQEKIDWTAKDANGKTAPQSQGEMPIGSRDLPYEMTATYLLPAGSKGEPCLDPQEKGERLMTKIPRWFDGVIRRGEKLSEKHGEAFARWAFGDPRASSQVPPVRPAQRALEALSKAQSIADVDAAIDGLRGAKVSPQEKSEIKTLEASMRERLAGVVAPSDEPPITA